MNWLGKREPEKYGTMTAAEPDALMEEHARRHGYEIEILYRNGEGEAMDSLYAAETSGVDAVVMNPGGFSYASYALRDCIRGLSTPVVEIHMTNHYARKIGPVTASAARAVFMGLGIQTYMHALDAAVHIAGRAPRA